jgi:hypothetical protein
MVNLSAIGGADYDVVAQAPSQGFLTARVKFNFQGAIYVLDDTGSGLVFIDTGTTWTADAGTYKELRIEIDGLADPIDYYWGGSLFYSSVAGVFAGTSVEQVVFTSDNWQNPGETGDFDDLRVVHGPIGACCLWNGTCLDNLTEAQCNGSGGDWQGAGSACTPGGCLDCGQTDTDNDGVGDACDLCPGTVPGATVDADGCPPPIPADFDNDGDVDGNDLDFFDFCYRGPEVPHSTFPQCQEGDFDDDSDIDADDFGVWQCCRSGANVPADPGCAQ